MSKRQRADVRTPVPWLLLAASAACEDPLTDPALIAGPRIAGARASAVLEPELAEPGAGQAVSLDWLVVSDTPGAFQARIAWCVAAPTVLGAPRCDADPFVEQSAQGGFGEPLSVVYTLPADLVPGAAWLAWIGICGSGEATFDAAASRFACPEGEALSGFYRGFVPEGAANRNPVLADDWLAFDGAAWQGPDLDASAPPAAGEPCLGRGLPELRTHRRSSVTFELGGDDREALESAPGTYAAHPRESLVYTHLASHAGLERAFSAIDYDATELGFEVQFEAEQQPGPEGETVRFFLLVRDERGGVDWLAPRACLLPP